MAVGAPGSQRFDGALERIEGVSFAIDDDLEGLVVVVPAHLTLLRLHRNPPCHSAATG